MLGSLREGGSVSHDDEFNARLSRLTGCFLWLSTDSPLGQLEPCASPALWSMPHRIVLQCATTVSGLSNVPAASRGEPPGKV